jgi:tetratricopeptide (TPR) repeat protein
LLQEFEGVQVLAFDRTIRVHGSVPEEQERKGHEAARQYLKASNASVLVWGRVLKYGGKSKPDLYLTAAAGQDERSRQYTLETGTEFSLPKVFWKDLADVLRLVIVTQAAQFKKGHYVVDRLQPFIARVRKPLEASTGRPGWDAEARASAQFALANALLILGEQGGQAERLQEAVALYRAVLEEWTRERVPLDWARTQDNLGLALGALGEREAGTARLEEAVSAYRAALEEMTRERAPLQWARTQNNLGLALATLGKRTGQPYLLKEARDAITAAREVYRNAGMD